MTKKELETQVKQELKALGFHSVGNLHDLDAGEVTFVACTYWHRFGPELLLDIGVLTKENWPSPIDKNTIRYTQYWDFDYRYKSWLRLVDGTQDAASQNHLDLDCELGDAERLELIAHSLQRIVAWLRSELDTLPKVVAQARDKMVNRHTVRGNKLSHLYNLADQGMLPS